MSTAPETSPRTDPHPDGAARFVGRPVSFTGDNGKRYKGIVKAATFAGFTVRGAIPDALLSVQGASGGIVQVSLVESRATFES